MGEVPVAPRPKGPARPATGAPRRLLALALGRAAGAASRALGRGGGTAITGLMAEGVAPNLAADLSAQLGMGSVVVTGTNGKTTTSRMLARVAREAKLLPLQNRSGSNLMRGIVTSLIQEADLLGRVRSPEERLGVFEVDEAVLPMAVDAVVPRVLVFTNLFRDQLDRYGEVDSVAARWRSALKVASPDTVVVLNADDPSVAVLADVAPGPVRYFGVDDRSLVLAGVEHAADSRWCPACGAEYAYDVIYYGHIGHWRCPGCGRERPRPDVCAVRLTQAGDESMSVQVTTPAGDASLALHLAGLYNVYNALAAVAAGLALGLPLPAIEAGAASVTAAFGRQERFEVDGRDVRVLLAKNPTGLNQVLRTIAAGEGERHLLMLLNDGIADGTDVSWIWDADFEMLAGRVGSLVLSGRRAEDLALRAKYAGLPEPAAVTSDVRRALSLALSASPEGGPLYVVPTYTAMLEVRELLARRGGRAHFWEEEP
jgi:UDP-N-acetylmuramyl tripeptide synthase